FQPLPSVWDLVESDSNNCLGRKCKDFERCFYFKARRQVFAAKVLVVNHALFFIDLMLKNVSKGFLPEYHMPILHEPHTLQDVAAEHLGLQITGGQVEYLLNKLFQQRPDGVHGLLTIHGDSSDWLQVEATRDAANRFFNSIREWCAAEQEQRSQSTRFGRAPQ